MTPIFLRLIVASRMDWIALTFGLRIDVTHLCQTVYVYGNNNTCWVLHINKRCVQIGEEMLLEVLRSNNNV